MVKKKNGKMQDIQKETKALAKVTRDIKSIKIAENRILGEGKYQARTYKPTDKQIQSVDKLLKIREGAKSNSSTSYQPSGYRDDYSYMVVDPVNATPIASIDDFSGMVSVVKQKQVLDCSYVKGADNRYHGGLLFTGGLRENIFRLKNDKWQYQHFVLANLYPDNAGLLSERSSNFNRQVGSSFISSMSRILTVGQPNVIPLRDGVFYPGNLGTASLSNIVYAVDSPCSLMLGSNRLNTTNGWTVLPLASGNSTIYPCLFTDKITIIMQASAIVAATISFDTTFYDASGNILAFTAINSAPLPTGNVNQTVIVELTVPATAVAWSDPVISSNVGSVVLYSLTLAFTPQTTALYPNHPTAFWEALSVPDYSSELSGIVNTWRSIAASVRWTDNTPPISANGLLAARVIDSNAGPGDSNSSPYSTLASMQGTYNGKMIGEQPGLYSFLKFNSINSRTFKNANTPFEFNGPYVFALSQHNESDVQLSRIEVCTIFEVTTSSQLILRVKPHVDIYGYAMIMNMITDELQLGDNPNHLKRLNKFISSMGRWTHQGLDAADNAISQARSVAARIIAGK